MSTPDPQAGPEPAAEAEALARYRAANRRRAANPSPTTLHGADRRRRLLRPVAGTPSGPGPDARDPQRVGSVWRSLADSAGWTNEMALWSLANRWPQIVGPQVAQHVVVVAFDPRPAADAPAPRPRAGRRDLPEARQQSLLPDPAGAGSLLPDPAAAGSGSTRQGGKLTLQADSAAWQQQMIWNLVHLQRRLDEELGAAVVGAIVVLGPVQGRRGNGSRRN